MMGPNGRAHHWDVGRNKKKDTCDKPTHTYRVEEQGRVHTNIEVTVIEL